MLLLPMIAKAQVNVVVVNMKDGSTTMFHMSDTPILSYTNNNLIIKSTSKEAIISIADIISITLEKHSNSSVTTAIGQSMFIGNNILFSLSSPEILIRVFSVDGQPICIKKTDSKGFINLNLDELPKGWLIISTPTKTIKLNNK